MTSYMMIFPTVATKEECFALLGRYSAKSPHFWRGLHAGQWFEIESAEYWYFLECLPPLAMTGGAFAMSEYTTADLTSAFFQIDKRHYCMTVRIPEGEHEVDQEIAAIEALQAGARAIREAIQ